MYRIPPPPLEWEMNRERRSERGGKLQQLHLAVIIFYFLVLGFSIWAPGYSVVFCTLQVSEGWLIKVVLPSGVYGA